MPKEITIINKTAPVDRGITTAYDLSNGDIIHVHQGGDVWLYKEGRLETARYFKTVDDAISAAQE